MISKIAQISTSTFVFKYVIQKFRKIEILFKKKITSKGGVGVWALLLRFDFEYSLGYVQSSDFYWDPVDRYVYVFGMGFWFLGTKVHH